MTSDQQFSGPAYATWELASPEEIRKRGNARVIRRRLMLCVAALAVTTMVTTVPMMGLRLGSPSDSRDVAVARDSAGFPAMTSGLDGNVRTIPTDFPLGTGMDSANQQSLSADGGFSRLADCGPSRWADVVSDAAIGTATVQGVGGSGHEERRVLAVFANSTTAQDALAELERASKACVSDTDPRTRVLVQRSNSSDRWSSMSFVSTLPEQMHGMNRLALLRVGNAVLAAQSATTNQGGPGDVDVPPSGLMEVVEAMCVFDEARC